MGQAVDMEDTAEATSLGSQDDVGVQEGMEDKPQEDSRCNIAPTGRSQGGKYCHTHGNCTHSSHDCKTPGKDHKEAASFGNMMRGNHQGYV